MKASDGGAAIRLAHLRKLERQLSDTIPERPSALAAVRELLADAADADEPLTRDPAGGASRSRPSSAAVPRWPRG